jgi:hypothetical protein
MSEFIKFLAFLLALLASSSDIGFRIVQTLVQIVKWIEENIMNPVLPYNWFWLLAFVIPFFILGVGVWYELHKIRVNEEKRSAVAISNTAIARTLQLCKVVNGEKGYVPLKSNSHSGIDLAKLINGSQVYKITNIAKEYGYVQLDERIISDFSGVVVSPTGQYWIEDSHLEPVVMPTPSEKRRYIIDVEEVVS